MAEYKLVLPSMGEGVMEATVTGWIKNEGDYINEDDIILEIATDKVDSDVPSPVSGKLLRKLKQVDEICKVGEVYAILEIEDESIKEDSKGNIEEKTTQKEEVNLEEIEETEVLVELEKPLQENIKEEKILTKENFYSPLVKSICKEENISQLELENIKGTGLGGRITKEDLLAFVKNRNAQIEIPIVNSKTESIIAKPKVSEGIIEESSYPISTEDEVIEMDRMRKMIADHMVASKQISPHVTTFVETDVTNIVLWRNKNKDIFQKKEGEKLTFMPFFVQAIVKAIKDFPMINVSVDGTKIIKKKNINIGMATALPNGNLIVPVIKNADQLSLSGLTRVINDLAERARNNKLKPEDVKGGTYTLSNIGNFGNLAGTPIINQPEVAIMVVGTINKKPAVIETPQGDLIGIRHKMMLSHTFDHRVIDGALGGMFVKRVSDYLEGFSLETEV